MDIRQSYEIRTDYSDICFGQSELLQVKEAAKIFFCLSSSESQSYEIRQETEVRLLRQSPAGEGPGG
ncbi:hypothetical protein EDC15_101231 [Acetobacter aceti NBRC 14818]|nr:hypothetical protein EDC15_101231 [Acetobacter aceti NBRC 14818]GAN57531.1 hypothetical protein Abac_017_232 [Acetobacter aceti NBRC 14818]